MRHASQRQHWQQGTQFGIGLGFELGSEYARTQGADVLVQSGQLHHRTQIVISKLIVVVNEEDQGTFGLSYAPKARWRESEFLFPYMPRPLMPVDPPRLLQNGLACIVHEQEFPHSMLKCLPAQRRECARQRCLAWVMATNDH